MITRRGFQLTFVAATLGLLLLPARAQDVQQGSPKSATASTSEQSLSEAADAGKYAFLLFHRTDDTKTQALRTRASQQAKALTDRASLVQVDIKDPAEAELIKRFDVSRAPMPLVLAIAPTGAVTRHWFLDLDTIQLHEGFVSPGQARCLKALQDGKVVLVCIQNKHTTDNESAMTGVQTFMKDPHYASSAATVKIDPADEREATLLQQLEVSPDTKQAVTVLMAPPASRLATLEGATTKAAIVAAAKVKGCEPGSGCCPEPSETGADKATKKKPKPAPPIDT
ncbi:MAG: hypothetical protein AAF581_08755 [Planctomycetota bacterium]